MVRRCVIHQVLCEERDPNDLPIEALHASCIRMLTHHALHPSPALAGTIAKMLQAIARHRDRFDAARGGDLYAQAADVWKRIEADMTPEPDSHIGNRPVSQLH